MAKRIRVAIVFLLLMIITCVGWLYLNGMTPVLRNGSELPKDLGSRQYALTEIQWDEAAQGYRLRMEGCVPEDLTITVSDVEEASVSFCGSFITAWGADQTYQRVQSIRLAATLINEKNGLDILFCSSVWGSGSKELLNRRTIMPAKLLLGGATLAERVSAIAFGVSLFSVGMHVLLICISLVLFEKKRSEKYLMLIVGVSAVSLVATLMSANISIITIQSSIYNNILQPFIAICPVIFYAALCLLLYKDCAPKPLQRFLTAPWLILLTITLVALRIFINYSFYVTLRYLLWLPVVWTLSKACVQKKPGAWLMLVSYALSESVLVFMFLINNLRIAAPGAFVAYIRVNRFSYLFVLLASMFVSSRRFAEKFRESELLGDKLKVMNADLDLLVEERTRQLREEQEQKHILMTNIFHDMRSPIFILQGNLAQIHPVEKERHFVLAMQSKLAFMKRLTEDLFLISKLEDGAVLYEENRIDLSEAILSLDAPNRSTAESSGIETTFSCGEVLPVWADRSRLQQAFQNLIDNALRYTPKGGSIAIQAFRQEEEAVVQVTDTGFGIPEKDQSLIFERYFKSSRADNPHSSGLGLYIAKEIVTHHHGTICVRSAPKKGSCFEVRLPLLPEEA